MAEDPILRLSRLRIVKASADLEVQLAMKTGSSPALEILRRLRERAAESLKALPFLNLYDPKDFITAVTLQNEVKRYDEFLGCMRDIIAEGSQIDQETTQADREEFVDLLTETPEGRQEAIALGLIDDVPQDA